MEKKEETRIIDYRQTEIGRQNWEVCSRMLIHDLLDISITNPDVKRLLDFYSINYLPNGGYTMALPRLKLIDLKKEKQKTKKK
jgi:hypothetical protein